MRSAILLLALSVCLVLACSDDKGSTADTRPPVSEVSTLPAEVTTTPFAVSWSGTDSGSGIKHYDVQSMEDGGSWTDWLTETALTSSAFPGQDSRTYYFRCRAMDNAGNQEEYPSQADAQTTVVLGPGAEWESTCGGSMGESGYSILQTADGGYIVAGDTYSYGSGDRDMYLVKVSATGDMEWDETYGGEESDGARSVVTTDDGGYLVAGFTRSFGSGESDIYIVKVNSVGSEEWDLTYGGDSNDNAMCVAQVAGGGYIVAGSAHSPATANDVCLLKVTDAGAVDWYKTYGGNNNEYGRAVAATSDGGYIVTGGAYSFGAGGRDVYLFKVDSSGDIEWEETYGGGADDYGLSVRQILDGGYIVGGQTASSGAGGVDAYLIRVTATGATAWEASYGGNLDDYGLSVRQTPDGSYLLAGETYSFGLGETDAYLISVDASGNLEWTMTFGGASFDGAASLDLTADGGCVLVGYTSSFGDLEGDLYLIKVESD